MYLNFYTSGRSYVGSVGIRFSSTPQYYIPYCTYSYTNFPVSLPKEVKKVWRITQSRNSGIRLLIHCNNVEVLNILMSDSTCSDSSWSTYWSRTVGNAWFHPSSDTASDYFRAGQSGRIVYIHNMNISSHSHEKIILQQHDQNRISIKCLDRNKKKKNVCSDIIAFGNTVVEEF